MRVFMICVSKMWKTVHVFLYFAVPYVIMQYVPFLTNSFGKSASCLHLRVFCVCARARVIAGWSGARSARQVSRVSVGSLGSLRRLQVRRASRGMSRQRPCVWGGWWGRWWRNQKASPAPRKTDFCPAGDGTEPPGIRSRSSRRSEICPGY